MASYYPYTLKQTHPMFLNNWNSAVPLQNSPSKSSMPLIVNPVSSQLYPRIGNYTQPSPFSVKKNKSIKYSRSYSYAPLVTYPPENVEYVHKDCAEEIPDSNASVRNCVDRGNEFQKNDLALKNYLQCINENTGVEKVKALIYGNDEDVSDPLDFYLAVPKNLFPAARSITVDPNPIINEFCKMADVQSHAPWILDLELGIPRSPTTRSIPTYNVKLNCINCKNTPDAIHPGFESCNQDFKSVILFYYDYIISTWYNGYIVLNSDSSVENFQSWLMIPTQILGMCWS